MFNTFIDNAIDQIVVAKKTVAKAISPTKEVNQILVDFIDAQDKYTRSAIKATTDVVTRLGEVAMDRTPYAEAQKNFEKFFPSTAFATNKKAK
mgnify:CR=1 FL=1